MRAQTVNFDRSGTPYEKLGIGRHGIKKALLENPTKLDSMAGDANREWMNNLPEEAQELLDYNSSDPLAFTDYYGFDEDYYLENEAPIDLDDTDFHSDFRATSKSKTMKRDKDISLHKTTVRFQIGKLPDGSKVIHYYDGMGSGYIAHKDWLKRDK